MEQITEVLSREHRQVLEKLELLQKALDEHAERAVRSVLRFIDEPLVSHRRKEEEVLFPTLARYFSPDVGPVACMLQEHHEEHDHVEGLRKALDAGDWEEARLHGARLRRHLTEHIWKEDHILFPLAERLLNEAEEKKVRDGFASIGSCCPECSSGPVVSIHGEGEDAA